MNVLGDVLTIKIAGEQTDGMFSLLEVSVPPQKGPPMHIHNREVESYYILEGDFEITLNDRTVKAPVGTHLYRCQREYLTHTRMLEIRKADS